MNKKKFIKILIISVIAVFLIILIAAILHFTNKSSLSDEKVDLNQYYGITNNTEIITVVNTKQIEKKSVLVNNTQYIPLSVVRDNINSRYYYDNESNELFYVMPDGIVKMPPNLTTINHNDETYTYDAAPFILIGDNGYISIDCLRQYTNMTDKYSTDPNRIQITTDFSERKVGTISSDTDIRVSGGVKSKIITHINKNSTVDIVEDLNDWLKIHTDDGFIGYVQSKTVKNIRNESISHDYDGQNYEKIDFGEKINLGFYQVSTTGGNDLISFDNIKSKNSSLNVISPTWFFIQDTNGNISDISNSSFVDNAHDNGIKVWAILNDFDGGINSQDSTFETLKSYSARTNIINSIVGSAKEKGIDGIVVDIEQVSTSCGIHYIEFIRELSLATHDANIILSSCNYVPLITAQFNRKEQGVMCDYHIMMGYDENGTWSLEPGPNASLSYIKKGIEDTIAEGISADRLILGIPLYNKYWMIKSDNSFSVKAVSMNDATEAVKEAGATTQWDESTGYDYAEWNTSNGETRKIWLENENSINEKMKLFNTYDLAGVAFWKLGQETDNIWNTVNNYFQ